MSGGERQVDVGRRDAVAARADLEVVQVGQLGQRHAAVAELGDAATDSDNIACRDGGRTAVRLEDEEALGRSRVAILVGDLLLDVEAPELVVALVAADDDALDLDRRVIERRR